VALLVLNCKAVAIIAIIIIIIIIVINNYYLNKISSQTAAEIQVVKIIKYDVYIVMSEGILYLRC